MSETQRLRDRAAHARDLAWGLSDEHARGALEALATELELQATELEHKEQVQERKEQDQGGPHH